MQAAGTLLEVSWRGMLERVHGELSHVHVLYASALRKEQQEKEVFRAHCIRLKGERDVAREKLRRALGRQYDDGTQLAAPEGGESVIGIGVKRGRDSDGPAVRNTTPPLSASAATSGFFPSPTTQVAEHASGELLDILVSPVDQASTDMVDTRSYPSPSPSSPSPSPCPHSPDVPRSAIVECSSLEQGDDLQCVNDPEASSTCQKAPGEEEQEQQRDCDDESEAGRPSKRRRTHCPDVHDGDGCSPSPVLMKEEPGVDRQHEQEPASQKEGCNGDAVSSEGSPSSNPSPAVRKGLHLDLMYMPADDKIVCRLCA